MMSWTSNQPSWLDQMQASSFTLMSPEAGHRLLGQLPIEHAPPVIRDTLVVSIRVCELRSQRPAISGTAAAVVACHLGRSNGPDGSAADCLASCRLAHHPDTWLVLKQQVFAATAWPLEMICMSLLPPGCSW